MYPFLHCGTALITMLLYCLHPISNSSNKYLTVIVSGIMEIRRRTERKETVAGIDMCKHIFPGETVKERVITGMVIYDYLINTFNVTNVSNDMKNYLKDNLDNKFTRHIHCE